MYEREEVNCKGQVLNDGTGSTNSLVIPGPLPSGCPAHRENVVHVRLEGGLHPVRARARERGPDEPKAFRIRTSTSTTLRLRAFGIGSGFIQEAAQGEELPARRVRVSRRLQRVADEQDLGLRRDVTGGDEMFLAYRVVVGREPTQGEQRGHWQEKNVLQRLGRAGQGRAGQSRAEQSRIGKGMKETPRGSRAFVTNHLTLIHLTGQTIRQGVQHEALLFLTMTTFGFRRGFLELVQLITIDD